MKKNRFTKFLQKNFITFSLFTRNSLYESSASCSFGFVFSFIPVFMLVLSILSFILKNQPDTLQYVLDLTKDFSFFFDMAPIITQFSTKSSFSWVDVILIVWVIWVARNFFLYVARAMSRIFHSTTPQKGYVIQLMTFIGEFSLILGLIVIIIASFMLNQFFRLDVFEPLVQNFPHIFGKNIGTLSGAILYAVLFIFTTLVYRFEPRTAPKLSMCARYAFFNTLFFMLFSKFINTFMNFSNYNLVYGAISAVIVLMFKVYFFFMVFLYFAQYIYVSQNFDSLLFCEIYMLPENRKKNSLTQKLFSNPSVLQREDNTILLKKGDLIFSKGDEADFVYFIKNGIVIEEVDDIEFYYEKGFFFGEKSAVLKRPRKGTAYADSECEILKIEAQEFRDLLIQNPRASAHAVEKL